MPHSSDEQLLVLHGLRVKGVAEVEALAGLWGLDPEGVRRRLGRLCGDGLVKWRLGALPGWTLTRRGQEEGERLVAEEVQAAGARDWIEVAYLRFVPLNREVLDVCSAWQVRGNVVNRHDDAHYDAGVLKRLRQDHEQARPIIDDLERVLTRFKWYEARLHAALQRISAGELDFFTKPVIDSYHTVWFELHQDLLVTLGRDRAEEGS